MSEAEAGAASAPKGRGDASARKQPVHLGPDVWRRARGLHEDEGLGAAEIAERFGVKRSTVERRMRLEGWLRRTDIHEVMRAGDMRGLARMVARLITAFDAQIRAVEAQFGAEGGSAALADPAAVERNARTLGSLAKTLDILIELRGGLAAGDPQETRDAEAMRRELERRLSRLCREAGTPEGGQPLRG